MVRGSDVDQVHQNISWSDDGKLTFYVEKCF